MTDSLETQVHQSLVIGKTNKDVLLDQLDDLLERYLNTLHEYHRVTNELSKQLSEGYMSLAQANFHSSSSAIRYGQDFYDERMQAIRKVRISEHGRLASDRPYFSTYKAGPSDIESVNEDTPKTDAPETSSTTTEPESEEPTPNPDADGPSQDSEETKKETKKADKPTDPLKWFGILVPPALRAAQSTFVETVEGPIPQLATIIKDMRAQEIEIGRVKKQIKKL